MDGQGHALSLKVMRVSRPSLANSWQPFFTSSPSFSAHATESLLSLQGKEPLPGHPKTLRDLTHSSQLLTLPSSFGSIQLGQTFSSCLCLNNEATLEVEAATLRVEMQTATSKVLLAEIGGPDQNLPANGVLETIVNHEMKELGQHVLACHVSYRLPSSFRLPPGPASDATDNSLQTFRKYYKFSVTNPLSVKTKVHVSRSPAALLSRSEREKIFLEIHVQNLTQEPMWFERLRFESVDGWHVEDANISRKDGKSLFFGVASVMQPQDIRQYVYILTPTSTPSFPTTHAPGTVIPLGRLDLSWRSSFGEPGRLLTSLLTRRIPILSPQPPPSAVPPHIQRASTPVRPSVRPLSPQQSLSRASTPPLVSPTPFKPRPPSQQMGRPQSPALAATSPAPSNPPNLEVDLVVRSIPHPDIRLEQPFKISFELTLSGLSPVSSKTRLVHLAIQHLRPSPSRLPPLAPTVSTPGLSLAGSPRHSIEMWSPKSQPYSVHGRDSPALDNPPIVPSARGIGLGLIQSHPASPVTDHAGETNRLAIIGNATSAATQLPAPVSPSIKSSTGVVPLGPSTLFLPPLAIAGPLQSIGAPDSSDPPVGVVSPQKREVMQQFECFFVPMRKGFSNVGGMRVLLLEDREVEGMGSGAEQTLLPRGGVDAKMLREWDTVGEVWVAS